MKNKTLKDFVENEVDKFGFPEDLDELLEIVVKAEKDFNNHLKTLEKQKLTTKINNEKRTKG